MSSIKLTSGAVVWVPCEVKDGIFPNERHVTIDCNAVRSIVGYVPREEVHGREGHSFVRSVVLSKMNGKYIRLILRGGIFSTSNVVVPRKWLQEVGRAKV